MAERAHRHVTDVVHCLYRQYIDDSLPMQWRDDLVRATKETEASIALWHFRILASTCVLRALTDVVKLQTRCAHT